MEDLRLKLQANRSIILQRIQTINKSFTKQKYSQDLKPL